MLNCLYDCRYCFLQGMMQSANYILFVNYEDFGLAIENHSNEHPGQPVHFFSGYDCDSLALEPVTGFAAHFLPFFADLDNAWLELRTKSTQIRSLLETRVIPRCIVAFSFTPETVAGAVEHKAPNVQRRIEAMLRLQQGWLLGLRFDPIIYQVGYQQLFECIFRHLDLQRLHSVSLGVFRLPENYYKKNTPTLPPGKAVCRSIAKLCGSGVISRRPGTGNDARLPGNAAAIYPRRPVFSMSTVKRTILITGCSSGIGWAIARKLLRGNHRVLGISRDCRKFTVERTGFVPLQMDLGNPDTLPDKVKSLRTAYPDLDAVIFAAGMGQFGSLEEFSCSQIQQLMTVNFTSQAILTRELLPGFRKKSAAT